MRILVACEFSGVVRRAFREKGHDAWSCDLLSSEDSSEFHIKGDVLNILEDGWDMIIAHPPCTYLSVSGMHWTTRGLRDPKLTEDALDFVKKFLNASAEKIALENPISIISSRIRKPDQIIHPWMFGHNASKKTCLWLKNLNPLKINPSQIIPPQGWENVVFSSDMDFCPHCCEEPFCKIHNAHYVTCPCIGPTEEDVFYRNIDGIMFATRNLNKPKPVWANQTPSGQNKLGPSSNRWKLRSKTFKGIADAMADQWGRA